MIMKTQKIFSILPLAILFSAISFAQKKTESIPVSGNCGMCEAKIEKAANAAGASSAEWNRDTKMLTVSYKSGSTSAAKIQQAIAAVGYDTRDFKASDEAYNGLHACCKYDRKSSGGEKHECSAQCEMKDGKCTNREACKDKGCCKDPGHADCRKDGKCEKHG